MLEKKPKNAGARGIGKSGVPPENPTLKDLGLDKKTSSIAQKLASLPPEQFEQVKAGTASIDSVEIGERFLRKFLLPWGGVFEEFIAGSVL